jgi:hypothetical protein
MRMAMASLICLSVACSKVVGSADIIAAVKQDSLTYCSTSKEGCEFRVSKGATGWGVMAFPIRRGADGRRSYVPGDFQGYSYDIDGHLIQVMPGL